MGTVAGLTALAVVAVLGVGPCSAAPWPSDVADRPWREDVAAVADDLSGTPVVLPATLPEGFVFGGSQIFRFDGQPDTVVFQFHRNYENWVRVCTVPDGVDEVGTCMALSEPDRPVVQRQRFGEHRTLVVWANDEQADDRTVGAWAGVELTQDWAALPWTAGSDRQARESSG